MVITLGCVAAPTSASQFCQGYCGSSTIFGVQVFFGDVAYTTGPPELERTTSWTVYGRLMPENFSLMRGGPSVSMRQRVQETNALCLLHWFISSSSTASSAGAKQLARCIVPMGGHHIAIHRARAIPATLAVDTTRWTSSKTS